METAPLKTFATWARTALIREVTARISVVLTSQEQRQEQPKAIAALEKAVNAAGGGDKGRDTVADTVAYTWFNRIIALRFMDANGYTGIGVVSPERGREVGQPEILAEAKRGNIDSAVVTNKRTVETVTSLLNGTRPSADSQGEAYALLLAEYCRHWNRSMPFMFEREGDYTELLIPANLLADDSVLARAVTSLTEEVCKDVEVIGWLYQFYISERKDEVFAGFKKNNKAGPAEIPAATQLFTPHWIVRYLVENSLGRLWLLNRPNSQLAHQMEYYIPPVDDVTDFLKVSTPEELKVIDPACGSGHILTATFDLLYAIYEEEGYAPSEIPGLILQNNLYGTEIDPRAGALAAFALMMKARGRQRTFFNRGILPNICVLQPIRFESDELDYLCTIGGTRADEDAFWNQFEHADMFGSLVRPNGPMLDSMTKQLRSRNQTELVSQAISERAHRVIVQAEYLSSRYHILVANPPYMGSSNMNAHLAGWLRLAYPLSKSDLMTAFMERASSLTRPRGTWAMINLPSWMFLSSYEALRELLLRTQSLTSMLHLGRGVFGADFGSVGFVVDNIAPDAQRSATYRRLFDDHVDVRTNDEIESLFRDETFGRFEQQQQALRSVPGSPIAYWLSAELIDAFAKSKRASSIVQPRKGLTTGEDGRFLRRWSEVSSSDVLFDANSPSKAAESGRRWFPCNKGGAFRRWYGNQELVIDWQEDGRRVRGFVDESGRARSAVRNPDFYFQELLSWSDISSGRSSFRYFPPGFVFNAVGPSFPVQCSKQKWSLLALLNSQPADALLRVLSPTIHFEVGQVANLPVRGLDEFALEPEVLEAIHLSRRDWDSREESWNFTGPRLLDQKEPGQITNAYESLRDVEDSEVERLRSIEESVNEYFIEAYTLQGQLSSDVDPARVSLTSNAIYRYGPGKTTEQYSVLRRYDTVRDLVSFAVGCMFGRYSLDEPGLILADQGATLREYLVRVPSPTFRPDADNVVPIVDGDWFEDDIVARFRQFLRAAFGEQHFEENLRFVTESLGVKDLRDYFVKSFYKDHVQRYKKRPIYWLFSSPKGSFNALIYMHRYTPSTTSTVLNEYLREFKAKLDASRQHHERLAAGTGAPREQAAAQKEVDRLRKVLLELDEYEHDVLYPLASQQVQIDLDDGVKANYPKLGAALKKIPGLEADS